MIQIQLYTPCRDQHHFPHVQGDLSGYFYLSVFFVLIKRVKTPQELEISSMSPKAHPLPTALKCQLVWDCLLFQL